MAEETEVSISKKNLKRVHDRNKELDAENQKLKNENDKLKSIIQGEGYKI